MGWYTEGVKANPVAATLLADTGPTAADTTGDVVCALSSTVSGAVVFEHRNATNDATLHSHIVPLGTNGFQEPTFIINVAAGERVRVITGGVTIVGNVQASLMSNII